MRRTFAREVLDDSIQARLPDRGPVSRLLETLIEQHDKVSRLLLRAEAAARPEERRDLWSDIRRELISHKVSESEVVCSALKQRPRGEGIALTHELDANDLENLVQEIDRTSPTDQRWSALVRKFAFRVRDHAEKEESVIIPLAKELLTASELEKMELDYLTAKARVASALV